MLEEEIRQDGKMELLSARAKTIAVVGDIHEQWEAADGLALKHLGVDLVLFVGDFGNESVEVVRRIADLDVPKAVIAGNHDAWYSASGWGRQQCPYDRRREDRVQQQLDLLGSAHVGYDKLDFPALDLSVVGSRPFSWGGSEWKNASFYLERYGVANFAESTERIVEAAASTGCSTPIFLGHNGPKGLGDTPESICGRDWKPIGGDFGDPDLTEAIARTRNSGKSIPLVAFGHMHHRLRHTQERLRTPVVADAGRTVYLNAASVPRIIGEGSDRQRNFSLVELSPEGVDKITLVWVAADFSIASERLLYCRQDATVPVV